MATQPRLKRMRGGAVAEFSEAQQVQRKSKPMLLRSQVRPPAWTILLIKNFIWLDDFSDWGVQPGLFEYFIHYRLLLWMLSHDSLYYKKGFRAPWSKFPFLLSLPLQSETSQVQFSRQTQDGGGELSWAEPSCASCVLRRRILNIRMKVRGGCFRDRGETRETEWRRYFSFCLAMIRVHEKLLSVVVQCVCYV